MGYVLDKYGNLVKKESGLGVIPDYSVNSGLNDVLYEISKTSYEQDHPGIGEASKAAPFQTKDEWLKGQPKFIGSIGNVSSGFGFGDIMEGLGTVSSLAKVGLGFGELGLAKDRYKFDKKMKEREWGMADEAYQRSKARAQNIGNQMTTYGR